MNLPILELELKKIDQVYVSLLDAYHSTDLLVQSSATSKKVDGSKVSG